MEDIGGWLFLTVLICLIFAWCNPKQIEIIAHCKQASVQEVKP